MTQLVNQTKKGILMVTMLVASLSFANEKAPFNNLEKDVKKTSLYLNNVKEGNLLSIKDNYGVILYKELIQKTGVYIKGFDLSSLPNGNYVFELDADIEIKTMPFTVMSSNVVFNRAETKSYYKPVTRVNGDFVYISKLALNNEPLKIDVYYEENGSSELMLTETIKDTKNIERVYKLTGLNKGSYKIVYNSDNKEFTKFIN